MSIADARNVALARTFDKLRYAYRTLAVGASLCTVRFMEGLAMGVDASKKKWTGWITLAVIVVAAGIALALTNGATEAPMADKNLTENEQALRSLFPEADAGAQGFESVGVDEGGALAFAYRVKQNGGDIGHVMKTTVEGYGGPIDIIVGTETSGAIRGIIVGGDEFNETADLGAKAKDAEFTDQFKQKTPPLALGEDIDAISGATVTSRAVVDGVNNAVGTLGGGQGQAQTADARTANASVIGYAGPVLVRLGVDADGAISSLSVGAERFAETEELGGRAREDGFTSQFIGRKPPLGIGDIDAISGATVTSQAVVDAVNAAYEFLNP